MRMDYQLGCHVAVAIAWMLQGCGSSDTATESTAEAVFAGGTVSGPVTSPGEAFATRIVDLGDYDYVEEEFFFEGKAVAYVQVGDMTMDGKWVLEEDTVDDFKTRLLVRRPTTEAAFNGTVIVEWLNVSGGVDADPGFMFNHELILRDGYAWVGVSAQQVGIEGGGFSLGAGGEPLKDFDPDRYGSLHHPGDAYSYDIYSQAAAIVLGAGDVDILGGLEPAYLIAYGESQSAGRMVSYANGVHPLVGLFDAIFIHSRGAAGAGYGSGGLLDGFLGGDPVQIRDDLEEPVLQFQTETDVHGMLGFLPARQPDTDRLRTWEVAGTAHADQHLLDLSAVAAQEITGGGIECPGANDGPQHFVTKAALDALNHWMVDGTLPPKGDLLMVDDAGDPIVDAYGNTRGGIRAPAVDVPIATLSGDAAEGSANNLICGIFGSTTPLPPETLLSLYPSHDDYVTRVADSAQDAVDAGFVLDAEADVMVAEAEAAPVPD